MKVIFPLSALTFFLFLAYLTHPSERDETPQFGERQDFFFKDFIHGTTITGSWIDEDFMVKMQINSIRLDIKLVFEFTENMGSADINRSPDGNRTPKYGKILKFKEGPRYPRNARCQDFEIFRPRTPGLIGKTWNVSWAMMTGAGSKCSGVTVAMATGGWNGVTWLTEWVCGKITLLADGAWNGVTWLADKVWNGVTRMADGVWNGVTWLADKVWNGVTWLADGVWNGVTWLADAIWNGGTWLADGVWNGITWLADAIWNGGTWLADDVWNGMLRMADAIWNGATWLAKWIWYGVAWLAEWISNGVIWLADGVWNGVTWMADTWLAKWIWYGVAWLAEWIWNGFTWLGDGVWNGVTWLTEWTWNGTAWLAEWIWNGLTWTGRLFFPLNYVTDCVVEFYYGYLESHVNHIGALIAAPTWQDVLYMTCAVFVVNAALLVIYLSVTCTVNFIRRLWQARKDRITAANLPPAPKKPIWRAKPKKKRKNKNGW